MSEASVMRRRVASDVLLTALAQIATMLIGGVLAILVAAKFGSDARTDGFFAAYGVYALLILLAQSFRVSVVPRLVDSPTRFDSFNQFLVAVILTFLLCGVAFVALGDPLASLLSGDLGPDAHGTTRTALLILWPAAGCQLVAALSAAMMGVLGDYARAAAAYLAGGALSIVSFVLLSDTMGIDVVPTAILIGSAITVSPPLAYLARAGWRPKLQALTDLGSSLQRVGRVGISSLPFMLVQIMFLISVAVASHLDEGDVTTFSYGFFATGLVIALTASSVPIVLAAPLAATWDRNPATLRPHFDDVFRSGLVVLVPCLATAALIGDDLGDLVLTGFTHDEVGQAVTTFLILSPSAIAFQILAIPLIALFTLNRHRALSLLAVPTIGVQAALAIGAGALDSLAALAATIAVSFLLYSFGVLALLYGRGCVGAIAGLGKEILRIGLPAGACFALAALATRGLGAGFSDPVALGAGLLLYAATIAAFLPEHRSLAIRFIRSIRGSVLAARGGSSQVTP